MDSHEAFRRRGGHPDFGEDDVVYRFNSHGFRAPELDPPAPGELRVLALGCSFVFGLGLPRGDLFHERFCARLAACTSRRVIDLNLGAAGASNDFICYLAQTAVPALAPDVVLVHLTYPSRRDYISADGERVGFNPSHRPPDRRHREIHDHFLALSNANDDCLNLRRNCLAIAALLAGRPWLCSFTSEEHVAWMADALAAAHVVGVMPSIDTARDHAHPGRRSHYRLAEAYWTAFERNGWTV